MGERMIAPFTGPGKKRGGRRGNRFVGKVVSIRFERFEIKVSVGPLNGDI